VVNPTNFGKIVGITGPNICVNIYTFDPREEMIACCSSVVTPDGLKSLSAKSDLTSNLLTAATPQSIIINLVATSRRALRAIPQA
jgi:hypothetical protein